MNWRELVLRYAAKILDGFGEHDLARKLYDYRVPLLDGGGIYHLIRGEDRNWQVEPGSRQQPPRPGSPYDEMWVVPLPADLWDPPKEEKCCDCTHCRKSA